MLRALLPAALALATSASAAPLVFSEVHYHPADSELEFIELLNPGTTPVPLAGATFEGIVYTFGSDVIAPGERRVVARNRSALLSAYGPITGLAPGNFDGRLADEGETIRLVDATAQTLATVTYRPGGDWPDRADGLGSSLEIVDPAGDPDASSNWRASTEFNGSPGRAGIGPVRSVLVNEILTHTDPPLEDAVELYNPTDTPMDIGRWWLSDNRADPTRYRIPAGTVVPAGGFLVLYESAFNAVNPAAGDTPFTFNSARGDDVVLVAPGTNDTPGLWIQDLSFEAAANGVSFGRFPDGVGPLVTLSALSFGVPVTAQDPPEFLAWFRTGQGASNAPPKVGPLVIQRLMYHPDGEGDEFVELRNIGDTDLPLFDPEYPTNRWILDDAVRFAFPGDIVLEPGERIRVVGIEPALFRSRNPVPEGERVFGPWEGALDNAGERLRLLRPDPVQLPPHPDAGFVPYILAEEVHYLPTFPWPEAADGTGPALRRRDLSGFADVADNWEADTPPLLGIGTDPAGGTPLLIWTQPAGNQMVVEFRETLSEDPAPWVPVQQDPAPTATTLRTRAILPTTAEGWYRLRIP